MLKRILYGTAALGVLTAAFLLGSVSLGGAFAQVTPAASPAAQSQSAPEKERGKAKEQGEANEQAESAALASQAKITAVQANAAALGQFPGGTVKKTELDDENGTLVYSVELTDSAGKGQEVEVDAISGKVLKTEADEPEGTETPGAPETGEHDD